MCAATSVFVLCPPHYYYCNIIFALFAVFSAYFSAMSSSSSSSALSVRKADENNNAGRIDSAEHKRARLDCSGDEEQPPFASNVADADGAPAAPGAATPAAPERHREDHVVGAHASAARDARRTISEAAAAVAAESDVDEAHHVAAARNARRRIGYKAKQEAAAKQKAAAQRPARSPAQRSARNERDRLRYKASTQARVAEQEAVSEAAPAVAADADEDDANQLARLARNQHDRIRYEANKQARMAEREAGHRAAVGGAPAVASSDGSAPGAATPAAPERHREDHVVGAHASAATRPSCSTAWP